MWGPSLKLYHLKVVLMSGLPLGLRWLEGLDLRDHLREVRRADAAEAELEAAGLGEVVVGGQANRLAGRGDRAVPAKHRLPAVRRAGRVFRFDHGFTSK